MKRRKVLAFTSFLTSCLLALTLLPTISAADTLPPPTNPGPAGAPGPSVTPPDDPAVIKDARSILRGTTPTTSNNAMVYFDQNQVNFKSFISVEDHPAGQAGGTPIICLSPDDAKCTTAFSDTKYQQIKYDVAMGSCAAREIAACINSFSLVKTDGSKVKAEAIKRIYSKTSPGWASTFDAKTNTGYPGSDGPWIWRITDGGVSTEYLILGLVSALFNRMPSGSGWDASEKSLRLSIYPVKKYENAAYTEGGSETACLAVDTGVCYQRIAFAKGLRFSLDLRLPKVITGWLNGRLDKPSAYTENYNDNYSELIVEADPLEEIITGKWLPNTGAVTQYLSDSKKGLTAAASATNNLDIAGTDPDDQNAVKYYASLAKLFGEAALTNSLTWRLNTTSSGAQTFDQSCQKSEGVQGIVTSNASVYEPGSPQWDGDQGKLAYRIAAPIYKSDGKTENVGRYAFTMRADLIKCVYGVTTLPAYATVEVSYGDSGEVKAATTALGTNKEWVYLHANNFAFTGAPPTVSVKLEGWKKATTPTQPTPPNAPNQPNQPNQPTPPNQPNKPTPPNQPTPPNAPTQPTPPNAPTQPTPPTPSSASDAKVTITCIKGTTKKTVTGLKPTCPTGYKMQAAQVTITCTKGTVSKKVTGTKPQCPTGYKMSVSATNPTPQIGNSTPGNGETTITCVKGGDEKKVTGKIPVQCPEGYQMQAAPSP